MTPEYAGRLCDDLDKRLRGSELNLEGLADMLRVVLRDEAWRERKIRTGEIVKLERFAEFVTRPPLEGLGEKADRIKKLLRDDLEALAAFETAMVGKVGAPMGNHNAAHKTTRDNITVCPASCEDGERGTSRSYTLRRLSQQHPEIFQQVTAGELTTNQAAIKAGFRKSPTTLDLLQRAWRKAVEAERQAFLSWIHDA